MKLPGMGDVKNKNVAIGAGIVGGIVLFAYWKKSRKVQTPVTDGATVDPNAIDPTTGIPYGQEAGSGGGYYTNSSVPNPYVSQAGTTSVSTGVYTSNAAWLIDAEQYAVNQFQVSYTLASNAFGKYLRQDPAGLTQDEYGTVSEVIALIGQPPNGGPYRLIQAAPAIHHDPEPTPQPEPVPTDQHPGQHLQPAQWATLSHGRSLAYYANATHQSLSILESLNPGLNANDTNHATMMIKTSDPHYVNN